MEKTELYFAYVRYITRNVCFRMKNTKKPQRERYEESRNSEPTSDVNNLKQSAICNTKDEQPSIQFIVIHFTFVAIHPIFYPQPAIFFLSIDRKSVV